MEKLTTEEKVTVKIALLLLSLGTDETENFDHVVHEASYIAQRTVKALDDPSWWELPGRPGFNQLMARIRTKLTKQIQNNKNRR